MGLHKKSNQKIRKEKYTEQRARTAENKKKKKEKQELIRIKRLNKRKED